MRIIPAIDIIDGKCVRLTQGDYGQKKIYNENPLEVARSFEEAGLKYLHLVDLDGAKAGRVINWQTVKKITSETNLQVDFGGGIKTKSEIHQLLDLGVAQVNLGSIAVKQPDLFCQWLKTFGAEKIILSADVKNEQVQISGWQQNTTLSIYDLVAGFKRHHIRHVVCTDIGADGMLAGPNIDLYKRLITKFPEIDWIASGGVSALADLDEFLHLGLSGVIIGKAIYEHRIKLTALKKFTNGI